MPFTPNYPSPLRKGADVDLIMSQPDMYIVPTERRSRYRAGKLFDQMLGVLLEPDQLEWTKDELASAAKGVEKVIKLAIPVSELDVLRKHGALAVPFELVGLGVGMKWSAGVPISGRLKPPLSHVCDLGDFLVPIAWYGHENRPASSLGDALGRQLKRVTDTVAAHEARLAERVTDYMFGRPVRTAKQRTLSNLMAAYPEFDWSTQIVPYLELDMRKVGGSTDSEQD